MSVICHLHLIPRFMFFTEPMVSNHSMFSFNLPKMNDDIDKCYKRLVVDFICGRIEWDNISIAAISNRTQNEI